MSAYPIKAAPRFPSRQQICDGIKMDLLVSEIAVRDSLSILEFGDVVYRIADMVLPLLKSRDVAKHEAAGRGIAAALDVWVGNVASIRCGGMPTDDEASACADAMR